MDAWFCASEYFAKTHYIHIKPSVLYVIMFDKIKNAIVYDPNKPLYTIYHLKTPKEVYDYYKNNGLLKYLEIRWIHATSLRDVYGFYYLGGGSKSYFGSVGVKLWGVRIWGRKLFVK